MHTATLAARISTQRISAKAALNWAARCIRVTRERRALADLSASVLDDIGITEAQAMREAHKPFWA